MERSEAREFLRRHGVTHIVCVTAAQTKFSKDGLPGSNGLEPALRPALTYGLHLFSDKPDDPRFMRCFDTIHEFISDALAASEQNRVLVHCQQGQSRSAGVVTGYLMRERNIGFDQAFEMVRAARPQVHEHMFMFESQLRGMQRQQEEAARGKGADDHSGVATTTTTAATAAAEPGPA